MVGVVAGQGAKTLSIVGHGITVPNTFEMTDGVYIEPTVPNFEMQQVADGCAAFSDYSAVVTGKDMANFSIRVEGGATPKELAVKGWNSLWNFHLLFLAAVTPCCSLFSVSLGDKPAFAAANRNVVMWPFPEVKQISEERLAWARDNYRSFRALISDTRFGTAMRCYGNSHYLFDADLRIMLLWSGIEGLLAVDGELTAFARSSSAYSPTRR